MRIYYFGELIEDNGIKIEKEEQKQTQISLDLETVNHAEEVKEKHDGMQSIGDILKELDLTIDSFRSNALGRRVMG